MRILAFDPGLTTGIAYMEDGKIKGSLHIQFDAFWDWMKQYLDRDSKVEEHYPYLCEYFLEAHIVVIENFRLYAHKAQEQINSDFQTVQLIGALKLLCDVLQVPYQLQMANQIKIPPFSDEQLINRWGIDLKNKHERDAARHALVYWLKNGRSKELEELKERYKDEYPVCKEDVK